MEAFSAIFDQLRIPPSALMIQRVSPWAVAIARVALYIMEDYLNRQRIGAHGLLQYLDEKDYDEVHFFGDKTFEGGNDFEIFTHPRTVGHSIDDANPETTRRILEELFPAA